MFVHWLFQDVRHVDKSAEYPGAMIGLHCDIIYLKKNKKLISLVTRVQSPELVLIYAHDFTRRYMNCCLFFKGRGQ